MVKRLFPNKADEKPTESSEKKEAVNHPSHYAGGGIEVIDVIEKWGLGFHLGNTIKYIGRAGKKNPDKEIEDLRKAKWYLDRRIQQLEAKAGQS